MWVSGGFLFCLFMMFALTMIVAACHLAYDFVSDTVRNSIEYYKDNNK